MEKNREVLVITPALSGGGWISLEEPINTSSERFTYTVVGLGPVRQKAREYSLFRLPYFDYAKACEMLGSFFPLNFLYNLPLIIMATYLMIIKRPRIVIGNGFLSAYSVVFLAKILRSNVVISYHGCFEYYLGSSSGRIVRALSQTVGEIFVNSEGSKKDVLNITSSVNDRVITIKHWAHDAFFTRVETERNILRKKRGFDDKFVILYVGDISREKLAPMLLNTIDRLKKEPDFGDFHILFAGTGELVGRVKKLARQVSNVEYLGYIGSREQLSELYSLADVVWSFADTTYLARPAVEALASGTPIIIPDVSAVTNKAAHNVRIGKDLVPDDIGWLIDGSDVIAVSALILKLKREKLVSPIMRSVCRKYAEDNHSMKNLQIFIEALAK